MPNRGSTYRFRTNQTATSASNARGDMHRLNKDRPRSISRWLAISGAVVAVAVIAIELAAVSTRAAHNRRVRHLRGGLNVTVVGSGDPVIFLHGFRGSGRYWEPHVRRLADKHQVIIVDLLGFGYSPWPADAPYNADEHVDAIHRAVAPLTRGRKPTIVGHSAGALLAAEYTRQHRDHIARLILLNAPMLRSEEEAKARIRQMSPMAEMFSVQRFWARASSDLVCAFGPVLFRLAPRLEPDVPAHVARDAVLHRWESFDRTLRNVVLRSRLEETLRAIAPMRIMIIHGTEDRITDRTRLEDIASAVGADLVFLPGGHNIFLSTPYEVVRLLRAAIHS